MSSEEKNEDATPYKVEQARKKGKVAKSTELSAIGGVVVFFISLCFLFDFIGLKIIKIMEEVLKNSHLIEPNNNFWIVRNMFDGFLLSIMPVMFLSIIISVTINVLQTRGLISFHPLKPDLKKINPIKGFKKFFSKKIIFDFFKNIIRLIIIGIFVYYFFIFSFKGIYDHFNPSIDGFLIFLSKIVQDTVLFFIALMLPFSVIDFKFQSWFYLKELKMSRKEIKDEYKNQEGDPEVKQQRRKRQKELKEKLSSVSSVSSADVVITNPTHLAVALVFDKNKMLAPKVVAKGKGYIAKRIKDVAIENNVTTKVDILLARKIYSSVAIDSEVPPEIYDEVATLYRWLYSLE
ncbi:EscU/YscU/HrcU family type III secretion system export apparatus switch protein [Vibrio chagasii]|uniref:EscU/YscU/HrcU family type III secretion system export apparatus switch protein n=1 Tax=Vibrio chagasii TaxID=170679 RepID=UPI0038CE98BC